MPIRLMQTPTTYRGGSPIHVTTAKGGKQTLTDLHSARFSHAVSGKGVAEFECYLLNCVVAIDAYGGLCILRGG